MLQYLKICLILLIVKESRSSCRQLQDGDWIYDEDDNRVYRRKALDITCMNLQSVNELDEIFSFQNVLYYYNDYKQYQIIIRQSNISAINPSELSKFSKIQKLDISGQHVQKIFPGAFDGLDSLVELNLNDNNLAEITIGIFNSLNLLEILDLTNNKIHLIQDFAFKDMSNLKHFNLNKNYISVLKETIFENSYNLITFDLSENLIKTVYTTLNSVKLNFSHNQLEILEELLLNHTKPKFEILDFSYNKISKIENCAFCNLTTLQDLNLKHNNISKIDLKIFSDLKNLTSLDLSENQIEKFSFRDNLSESKNLLQFLEIINLGNNKLHQIDNFVFTGRLELKEIYLNKNSISMLESKTFENLYYLKVLDLSENLIKSINTTLNSVNLNLSHNKLETLEDFMLNHTKPKFEILDFSYNKISKIENCVFCNFSTLRILNLRHNNISKIYRNLFSHLENLEILDLSENQIEEFSFGIFDNLISLQSLNISHNKITNLDHLHSMPNLHQLYFDNNLMTLFNPETLLQYLPNLHKISLHSNNFTRNKNCKQILSIRLFLANKHTEIVRGNSFDSENINGIACVNKELNNSKNSEKNFDQDFKNLFENNNDYTQNQFASFLNTFKNVVDSLNRNKTETVYDNSISDRVSVFSLIIQISILFALILVIYFNFFKNIKVNKIDTSHLELC